MKRTLLLAALMGGFMFAATGTPALAKTPKTTAKSGKAAGKGYDGTISKATRNMIVIDLGGDGKGVVSAIIADTTVITVAGKEAGPGDLVRGQTVHVTMSGGKAAKIEAS